MKVLVACEESQEVCKAFREKGHEAYSFDIQDVIPPLEQEWDLIIAHPPCTFLIATGNHKRQLGRR